MAKRRGRPRQFGTVVSVRLPQAVHDALCRESIARGIDLARVYRERLSAATSPGFSYSKYQRRT